LCCIELDFVLKKRKEKGDHIITVFPCTQGEALYLLQEVLVLVLGEGRGAGSGEAVDLLQLLQSALQRPVRALPQVQRGHAVRQLAGALLQFPYFEEIRAIESTTNKVPLKSNGNLWRPIIPPGVSCD